MKKAKDSSEGPRLDPWFWQHRVGLTPFAVSAAVLFYALGLTLAGEKIPAVFAVVITVGITACLWAIAKRKWGGSKKVKDRQLYHYVEALLSACTLEVVVLKVRVEVFGALTWNWLLWYGGIWALLTLLFGAYWWNDRVNLTKIQVQQDMRRWPDLAKTVGMPGLHRSQTRKTSTGSAVRFWWSPGTLSTGRVKQNQALLEQVVGAPEGMAKFVPVLDDDDNIIPTQIEMVWNDKAPGRKESIHFTEPSATSVNDPILLGYREDGEEVWFNINDPDYGIEHLLAGGTTGSGKSGLYHLLLAETAACKDLVRWGMDFKGGMAFKPWAPLFDWLIVDEEDALPMFQAAREVLGARAKYAAQRGWDPWQVDEDHPLLIIWIDECAIPFGLTKFDIVELGKVIAQQGRAAGVMMALATQHATNESVGSQQIIKNINKRFAFRCADGGQQGVLLPNSTQEVDCSAIPSGKGHAGKCYWSNGGIIDKLMMRIRFVSKVQIAELVEKYWEQRVDLDRGSARAVAKSDAAEAYADRHIWTIEDVVKAPSKEMWGEDEHFDMDQIWDIVLGEESDHPAPKEPALNTDPGATYDPAEIGSMFTDADTDQQEDIMPFDPAKGEVVYTADFLAPSDPDERLKYDQERAAFLDKLTDHISPEEARERLHKALLAAGPHGVKFESLQEICRRKSTWVNQELVTRMRDEGTVHSPSFGFWAYTQAELDRLKAPANS